MSVAIRPDFSIGRQHLGQAGRVAAGEDVFGDPGIGAAGPVAAADGVQQRHAVRLQAARDGVEEGRGSADADMLEHADRDDAVEAPVHRAVVQQLEIDAVLQALGGGAGAGLGQLLGATG
jgi:hypothetical protein